MKVRSNYPLIRRSFFLFFCFYFWGSINLAAYPIDVLRYKIFIKPNFKDSSIYGICTLHFRYLASTPLPLKLDFEGLKVRKVTLNQREQKFQQFPKILQIKPLNLEAGQSAELTVYYEGKPIAPSPFGGFYFSANEAYNLGVSLEQIPHSFGRIWFPCIDNFTDKALYEFELEAPPGITGVANGTLREKKILPSGNTLFRWSLAHPIPTYLASIAFGEYACLEDTLEGLERKIPVSLYVKPEAVTKARASFQNLQQALSHFESLFGPYAWERVGYVSVAMQGGAMEHATNIAYPHNCIDGTLKYEQLWVHELSHSWFGNLVTCASAEDMWLNEGFARYCEALFFEKNRGVAFFRNYLQKIEEKVIKQAHINDEGYYPVSPIPQTLTYGSTVYDKGALVAHTLRGYLGDSLFFGGLRLYFKQYQFSNATTEDLKNALANYCQCNLDPFFQAWVYTPGFYSLRLDSIHSQSASNGFNVQAWVSQNPIHKKIYLEKYPVKIRFWSSKGETVDKTIIISEPQLKANFSLPFSPVFALLDPEQEICDYALSEIIKPAKDVHYKIEPIGLDFACVDSSPGAEVVLVKHFSPPTSPPANKEAAPFFWEIFSTHPSGKFGCGGKWNLKIENSFLQKRRASAPIYLMRRSSPLHAWEVEQTIAPSALNADNGVLQISFTQLRNGQYALFLPLNKKNMR
jgi:aminopeptidase N